MKTELLDPVQTEGLDDLLEREGRIERAQRNAYYEIGLELAAIRDRELYKIERPELIAGRIVFQTFEEYVQERWEWTRDRAYKLIEAATAAENVEKIIHCVPARESHVRPLLKLETDEERAEVWQAVSEQDGNVTAKLVEQEVEVFIARKARDWYTIDDWKDLDKDEQAAALEWTNNKTFNKQDNDSIKWARWSWNPVTGCRAGCNYCYARDIANRFFPQGFEPAFYPGRLRLPENTKVPEKASNEIGWKNVFTCSMADLFGKWVPKAWIDAVLETAAASPQWNFLFLTKYPRRLLDFDFPENAWVGTTVDKQSRVAAAEEVFGKLKAGVKFLSVEPMWEPVKFTKLRLFDWVIIGGASRSTETEEFKPARTSQEDWVFDLEMAARKAGCAIYEKENLLTLIQEYPGM